MSSQTSLPLHLSWVGGLGCSLSGAVTLGSDQERPKLSLHSISRGNYEIAVQLQPDMHVFRHGWLLLACPLMPLGMAEEGAERRGGSSSRYPLHEMKWVCRQVTDSACRTGFLGGRGDGKETGEGGRKDRKETGKKWTAPTPRKVK